MKTVPYHSRASIPVTSNRTGQVAQEVLVEDARDPKNPRVDR